MAAAPAVRFPVFGLVRLLGLAAAAGILFWAVHFRGGMALSTDEESKLPLFNVRDTKKNFPRLLPIILPLSRFAAADQVLILVSMAWERLIDSSTIGSCVFRAADFLAWWFFCVVN
jgi:hypothetical protein